MNNCANIALWPSGKSSGRWILLACLLLFSARIFAAESVPVTHAPSAWITPLPFARLNVLNPAQPGEDSRVLLFDRQVNAATNDFFFHTVRQVFTAAGVKNHATLSVDFDASHQTLAFHWIRIWRGSNALNRLDLTKIKVIQPERHLDEDLFSGTKSAVLFLEDVRPGDIIDYGCSIQGERVVNAGKFTEGVTFAFGEAVEKLSFRLLWPSQRRLFMKDHGNCPKPALVRRGSMLEYKWETKSIPAQPREDNVPSWYESHPWLQLSEFSSWTEVNQWALNLFKCTNALDSDVQQRIATWKKLPSKEARVLAALQFVQEEVRYLANDTAGHNYRPDDPSDVFARRYGDCKDKTLLLITLLHALQIEAWPALVNTEALRSLDNWQPTTGAFDHVISQVILDGKVYWLDGTAMYQRGPLAMRSDHDYERCLRVRPGTSALTIIPLVEDDSNTSVTEYFSIGNFNQPAQLKIVTVAEGRDAERLRQEFATTQRDEIQTLRLNSYAHLYPDIKQSSPLVFTDDEETGRIELTEFYTIDNFWTRRTSNDPYYCDFAANTLRPYVSRPNVVFRTMPLRVYYPRHESFHIRANFNFTYWAEGENKRVQDSAFNFSRTMFFGPMVLNMDCDYRSLIDSVSPDNVRAYLQHVDEAWNQANYRLTPIFY